MNKIIVILLNIFLMSSVASAYELVGRVYNEETKKPIIGATIQLQNTALGTYSKKYGRFEIKSIKKGNYTLLVSHVIYKAKKIDIKLNADIDNLKIYLKKQTYRTSQVVVSANKRVQTVQDVPISISVIDQKELALRNITKLDEILAYVPGVELNGDHVSIRGSSGFAFGTGSRIALLLDGFPLLSGDNGDMKYDALPLFNTERIEIVKGAGSALYGTSALGGVINIITKDPTQTEFKARLSSGFYTKPKHEQWRVGDDIQKTYGFDISFADKIDNMGILIAGKMFNDDSYRTFDKSKRWSIFSKINYDFSTHTKLSITGNLAEEKNDAWVYWKSLESANTPSENRGNKNTSKKVSTIAKLQHIFNQDHFIVLRTGLFATDYNNGLQSEDSDYRETKSLSSNTEIQMNSVVYSGVQLTYGLNYIYNNVDANIYGKRTQGIFSFYAQSEMSYSDFIFTLGGRFDKENTKDSKETEQFSPKFGVTYKVNEKQAIKASIGKGFRAPTVAERFASISFQGINVIPNAALKPETSWSYEVSYNLEQEIFSNPFTFDLAVFQNDFFDLIEPNVASDKSSDIKFTNLTRARVRGLELGFQGFLFDFLGVKSSITYLDPKDLTNDRILKYRSEYLWYSGLMLMLGNYEIHCDYRYKSKVREIDDKLRLQVKDYDARTDMHRVDVRFVTHLEPLIGAPLDLTINVNNLFDYYYTEMVGNLAPVRHIALQLDFKY